MLDPGERTQRSAQAVDDLIDAVRQHEQAIRKEAAELEQLRTAVLKAAEDEAADIVNVARSDISAVVTHARRRLLELSGSIRLAVGPHSGVGDGATDAAQRWQSASRRDVLEMIRAAKAEFDRPRRAAHRPDDERDPSPQAQSVAAEPSFESQAETERRTIRSPKVLFAAFMGAGVLIAGGTMWWAIISHTEYLAAESRIIQGVAGQPSRAGQPGAHHGVLLRVEVTRPIWIRTTIDGRADAGAIQQPGQPREITGDQEISLRAGDGGGVRVSFNGAEPVVLGHDGEPITRRFAVPASAPQPARAPASSSGRGSPGAGNSAPPAEKPAVTSSPTPAAEPAHAPGNSIVGTRSSADTERSRAELQTAAYRWLDAYYRGDSSAVASLAPGGNVSDERAANERMPGGRSVQRTFEGLNFQFAGDTAVLSARMMERADDASDNHSVASWLSQTWLRESGAWRLIEVRLLGDARVKALR